MSPYSPSVDDAVAFLEAVSELQPVKMPEIREQIGIVHVTAKRIGDYLYAMGLIDTTPETKKRPIYALTSKGATALHVLGGKGRTCVRHGRPIIYHRLIRGADKLNAMESLCADCIQGRLSPPKI